MFTKDEEHALHGIWSGEAEEQGRVVRVFCSLQDQAYTGIVEVSAAEKQTLFSFSAGDPTFVEECTLGDTLAQALMKQGMVSTDQYSAAVERMTDGLIDNEDVRFCEIAMELGYLTSEQVFEAITERVRNKVIEAVGWRECEITIDDASDAVGEHAYFSTSLGPLLYKGIRTHYDVQRAGSCLGQDGKNFVRPTELAESISARFELSQEEERFIASCDGVTAAGVLVKRSKLPALHAWQLLCLLKLSGSAEFSSRAFVGEPTTTRDVAPEASRPPSTAVSDRTADNTTPQPATDRSEPAPDRPETAVRGIPYQHTSGRRYGIRTAAQPGRAQAATEARAAPPQQRKPLPKKTVSRPLKRSTVALDRLSRELRGRDLKKPMAKAAKAASPVKELLQRMPKKSEQAKQEPESVKSEEGAMVVWDKGRRALRQQHFNRARDEFARACELDPENSLYQMYHLWTIYREATDPITREEKQNELKKLAETHTLTEGHISFAHYVLGHIALNNDNERAAEKHFKKSVDKDPKFKDAQRYHRLLVNRRQKK